MKRFEYKANNDFHYFYEENDESQNNRYNNKQNTQIPRRNFNQPQNTYTIRYKKGNNYRNVNIVFCSRNQKSDIQD